MSADTETPQDPGVFRWIIGFLLVGAAWGITNPFIRKAAVNYSPPQRAFLTDPAVPKVKKLLLKVFYAAFDLLRTPSYAVPLVINLTGSVWFFLLIGHAELSLMVPIVNSLAFLFTVVGDWLAVRKMIALKTWIGMALVCVGIGLCVDSKRAK
ncbi:hypothetical protein EX30DRAFT_338017 [Ascodesmis nigricans]|uniref:Integral membrane protein n=1 Tax=Ascodesmis nigricans TaxID=341454 RepID=A0A4S2N8W1_9PEZI|nr:hypothetical protein EX30DRAFT_338017 [Ascodesmis nigricans]